MNRTAIEWAELSWNPTRGCSKVDRGCQRCYAEREAVRRGKLFRRYVRDGRWNGRVELIPSKLAEPLTWKKPALIFTGSMSDIWHENLPVEQTGLIYSVMRAAHWHRFLVLTKRHERRDCVYTPPWRAPASFGGPVTWLRPVEHIWEGASVNDQASADMRLPFLRRLRAIGVHTFLSYEPATGPIDPATFEGAVDWIIAGGESGPGAAPGHPTWFRRVRDWCRINRVPFFFKQWGTWAPWEPDMPASRTRAVADDGAMGDPGRATSRRHIDCAGWVRRNGVSERDSSALPMCAVGKWKAGHILDGVEHQTRPDQLVQIANVV